MTQASRAVAIACGAHVGDEFFEGIHVAFGAVVAIESRLPPESVLDLAKLVALAVELGPVPAVSIGAAPGLNLTIQTESPEEG
jgi:hypothetical protein